jgi:hypothetical protein
MTHEEMCQVIDAAKAKLDWFQRRELYVRQLVGICEDCARPGGDIDAAWRALVNFEAENPQ